MDLDDASAIAEVARRTPRPTAIVALVSCAALLVASIGVGALANWVQRESGTTSTPVERAWFQDATSVDHGVTVLAPIQFVIVPTSSLPITWVAYNNRRTYQRGIAQGSAGRNVVVTLPTWTMKPSTWLRISIAGIPTSLRAWVR